MLFPKYIDQVSISFARSNQNRRKDRSLVETVPYGQLRVEEHSSSNTRMAMSVQKPHSCKHCQKLFFKPFPRKHHDRRHQVYEFDFSSADIIQAAADQCAFCQWLLDDMIIHPPPFSGDPETHDKLKLCASFDGFDGSALSRFWGFRLGDCCRTLNGFGVCTPSGELFCLSLPHMTAQAASPVSKCIEIYLILIDNVASSVVTTRPIYRDVGSE